MDFKIFINTFASSSLFMLQPKKDFSLFFLIFFLLKDSPLFFLNIRGFILMLKIFANYIDRESYRRKALVWDCVSYRDLTRIRF